MLKEDKVEWLIFECCTLYGSVVDRFAGSLMCVGRMQADR